jgi:hypothetical protein
VVEIPYYVRSGEYSRVARGSGSSCLSTLGLSTHYHALIDVQMACEGGFLLAVYAPRESQDP